MLTLEPVSRRPCHTWDSKGPRRKTDPMSRSGHNSAASRDNASFVQLWGLSISGVSVTGLCGLTGGQIHFCLVFTGFKNYILKAHF